MNSLFSLLSLFYKSSLQPICAQCIILTEQNNPILKGDVIINNYPEEQFSMIINNYDEQLHPRFKEIITQSDHITIKATDYPPRFNCILYSFSLFNRKVELEDKKIEVKFKVVAGDYSFSISPDPLNSMEVFLKPLPQLSTQYKYDIVVS